MVEEQTKKPGFIGKLKHWWLTLVREEWELTLFFPGETKILPDGSRIESGNPKMYSCKRLIKISPQHFIFVDTNGVRNEIKVVSPIGYDLRKIY